MNVPIKIKLVPIVKAEDVHWLDADVFIQAKNGPYPFDMVKEFWIFLSRMLDEGYIRSSLMVYKELTEGTDYLAQWCKSRKSTGLAVRPSKGVQSKLTDISNHVVSKYGSVLSAPFLNGGDAWIIAHALEGGGTVVTQESEHSKGSKIKVPTVCKELDVRCIDTYRMLKALRFSTGL